MAKEQESGYVKGSEAKAWLKTQDKNIKKQMKAAADAPDFKEIPVGTYIMRRMEGGLYRSKEGKMNLKEAWFIVNTDYAKETKLNFISLEGDEPFIRIGKHFRHFGYDPTDITSGEDILNINEELNKSKPVCKVSIAAARRDGVETGTWFNIVKVLEDYEVDEDDFTPKDKSKSDKKSSKKKKDDEDDEDEVDDTETDDEDEDEEDEEEVKPKKKDEKSSKKKSSKDDDEDDDEEDEEDDDEDDDDEVELELGDSVELFKNDGKTKVKASVIKINERKETIQVQYASGKTAEKKFSDILQVIKADDEDEEEVKPKKKKK